MSRGEVALYCIAEVESADPLEFRYFKIGIAKSVPNRLASLQTGNAKRLRPIMADWYRSLEDARRAEKAVHLYLTSAACVGEWFDGNAGCPFEAMSVAGVGSVKYVPRSDVYYDNPAPNYDAVLLPAPMSYPGRDTRAHVA